MYIIIGISFLVHIFTILAIVVLYQRRTLERVSLPSVKEDVETLHQSMEAFIDEIEKENEGLYERMVGYIQEKDESYQNDVKLLEEKIQRLEKEMYHPERNSSKTEGHIKSKAVEQSSMDVVRGDESSEEESHDMTERASEPPFQTEATDREEAAIEGPTIEESAMEEPASAPNKFEQAKELYRQGFSIDHIAKVLQMGKGEAALVVHLMKRK
ncbi:DUF6115 domain-containing protein [Bacillus horti]|uniref:UBA domain-containing protein n=1 Tax=Caldalkalibacillus horti TaxID=77523 RepID=A0ABT9VUM7_9BACI|nr:hypothetical protein [Bacillus horti]MDQ0164692.1 hypothetical protein [Bacillus horti]